MVGSFHGWLLRAPTVSSRHPHFQALTGAGALGRNAAEASAAGRIPGSAPARGARRSPARLGSGRGRAELLDVLVDPLAEPVVGVEELHADPRNGALLLGLL